MGANDDLIHRFDSWWAPTTRSKKLRERLTSFHSHGLGAREGKFMMVVGTDGTGKTFGLQSFRDDFSAPDDTYGAVRPVVFVEAPAGCTLRSFASNILCVLGIDAGRASQVTITRMVLEQLKAQQVQTLIIDEFHHLMNRWTMKMDTESVSWVKGIINARVCGIVLAGQPMFQTVIQANSELWGRRYRTVSMDAFNWTNETDQLEYRTFLNLMDLNAIVLPKRSNLGKDMPTALRIHHFSKGRLRNTCLLVRVAYEMALELGAPCITHEILADAVDELAPKDGKEHFNPFRVGQLEPAAPASPDAVFEAVAEYTPLPVSRRRQRN